jgi:hypothetical protein
VLEYGEIFVKFDKKEKNNKKESCILYEKVLVGRNPSLHPGDLRIL